MSRDYLIKYIHSSRPSIASGCLLGTVQELLDCINYSEGSQYERDVVRECFRFISSETEYTARAQHLLIRCLQTSEAKDRQGRDISERVARSPAPGDPGVPNGLR